MYFKTNDISLYYEKYGTSQDTILILPGWGNNRTTFFNIINYFKDSYSIYIIDYPGFGNSPIPQKDLTIYDYAILIKKFIKMEIKTSPIIIAHSFGGRIATLLTGYYKEKIKKMTMKENINEEERKKNEEKMITFRNIILGEDYFGEIFKRYREIKNFIKENMHTIDVLDDKEKFPDITKLCVGYNEKNIYSDIENKMKIK